MNHAARRSACMDALVEEVRRWERGGIRGRPIFGWWLEFTADDIRPEGVRDRYGVTAETWFSMRVRVGVAFAVGGEWRDASAAIPAYVVAANDPRALGASLARGIGDLLARDASAVPLPVTPGDGHASTYGQPDGCSPD